MRLSLPISNSSRASAVVGGEMDPRGVGMMSGAASGGGGDVYNFAEIWPRFQMSANAASYGLGLDPILTDQRSNDDSRKRRDEDEHCAKGGGASTSSSNGGSCNNNNSVSVLFLIEHELNYCSCI